MIYVTGAVIAAFLLGMWAQRSADRRERMGETAWFEQRQWRKEWRRQRWAKLRRWRHP